MGIKRKPSKAQRKADYRRGRSRRIGAEHLEDRVLLAADGLEPNDNLVSATVLGSDPSVTLRDLTIHELPPGSSDEDFFRITASQTGMLIINALFDHEAGDLNLAARDSRGFLIATSESETDNERIVLPVVAQESYIVKVDGVAEATNSYSLELENFAAASPQAVHLISASDTGMRDNDLITQQESPHFSIQADLSSLVDGGIPLLTADEATNGERSGASVFVTVRDATLGTVNAGYAEPLGDDLFSYTARELSNGEMIVSASVHIFDGRQVEGPAAGVALADPALGATTESEPIKVIIDTFPPSTTSPQLLPSSDSGMLNDDRVTNIMEPAFVGIAGPNERIRVLANGLIVGEGITGTDGRWEVTVEPLTDGIYEMTADVQDLAGNFGTSELIRRIEVDTLPPNTPFLDLTSASDTGIDSTDNVTGDNTLSFTMTTTDPNSADHLSSFNYKYRLYVRPEGGTESLVYNSATDATIPAADVRDGFTNLEFLTTTLPALPDGVHNFKLEVEDRAGNISHDFLLSVTIDTSLPTPPTIDLVPSSDTGMSDSDNVTRFERPTLAGIADVGGVVNLFANGQLVGAVGVGGDDSDGISGNGLGAWEITAGSLEDGVYEWTALVETDTGTATSTALAVEVDTTEPNTPHLDLLNDTGHSSHDNITGESSLTFNMTTEDPAPAGGHLIRDFNYKFRIYARPEGGAETLVYNSVMDAGIDPTQISEGFTLLEQLQATLGPFPDGIHNFKLEVEDRAGNISRDTLLDVQIDSSLQDSSGIVMLASSDSGMDNADRVTNIIEPTFTGLAELGAEVSLFANGNLVGSSTALHEDPASSETLAAWSIVSAPLADGIYEIFARVEDWAGNTQQTDTVTIEVDTEAPNTPFLDLDIASDDGASGTDNMTSRDDLVFNMSTTDPRQAEHLDQFNYKYRLYMRTANQSEQLVYDSSTDDTLAERSGGFTTREALQRTISDLPEGAYNFKLEVEDRAGNISHDVLLEVIIGEQTVVIVDDIDVPTTIQLVPSSDAGMDPMDGVTSINAPTFSGLGEADGTVQLFANGSIIGSGTVGGDLTDGVEGDGAGLWQVTSGVLSDGVYMVTALVEDASGNLMASETLTIEIDTLVPNTPVLDLLPISDSGIHDQDNVTLANPLVFNMTSVDPNQDSHLSAFNYKFRLFLRSESGAEQLVYDSVADDTIDDTLRDGAFISLDSLQREILLDVPDGVHNFKLEVEDRAGNISEDFLLNIWIDTSLRTPAPSATIDLLASSDSGMSDRDDVTRINTPSFGGVAEAGATVTLFANGQLVGVGRVGSDETDFVPGDRLGTWEVTVESLDDGVYEILAHIEDAAGNFVRTDSISVEVDTTEPNTPHLDLLNDTGHSSHDNITGESSLTFNMTTEDPAPAGGHLIRDFNYKFRIYARPEGGAETLVYNSVIDAGIDPTQISEGFTLLEQLQATLGPFPDGIHNFKLEVEDRAGNISRDTLLDVQIDSSLSDGPTIDLVASSDSGMSDEDNVTSISTPSFTGISEVGATVRLRANGVLVGTAEVQSDDSDGTSGDGFGEWEITSERLDDGVYEITADVEDWAGNVITTAPLTIEVDSVQPNTPFLDLVSASDSGIEGQDEITRDSSLTFTMTTTDAAVGGHLIAANYKFRLYLRPEGGAETLVYDSAVDGEIPAANLQDGLTDLNFLERTLDVLPDGAHNFKLEVEDRAGNISDDFLLNILIDTTLAPPTIDLAVSSDTGMSDEDNVTNKDQPTFVGTGDVGDRVSLFANDVLVGVGMVGSDDSDSVAGDGRGSWEVRTEPLDDGVYSVSAHVEDLAGNFQRTTPLLIEVDTLEPNTPLLDLLAASDTGHSSTDNITANSTLTLAFATADPNQLSHLSEFNYKYRLFGRSEGSPETLIYNSVTDDSIPTDAAQGGFTSLEFLERTIATLSDGVHNLKLEVEDRAGNISHDVILNVEIDTTLPQAGMPELLASSDTGMSDTDNVTNKDQPAFSGVGTAETQVRLFANGLFVGTAEVGSDESDGVVGNGLGVWEITSEPLADDVYVITATYEDWAGNTSQSSDLVLEVDTVAPNTPYLDLLERVDSGRNNDDNITNAEALSFSATTEDPNAEKHATLFPGGENLKYRLFLRPESGVEELVYDSSVELGTTGIDGLIAANQVLIPIAALAEGAHNLKLEVEDRAGNISHDFLLDLLIDRTPFEGTVEISADSITDTGVWGVDSTFGDGITGAMDAAANMTFSGLAEANNVVTLLIDGQIVGTTVAGPFDGDDAFTTARWELSPNASLAADGSEIIVRFEDPAGNRAEVTTSATDDLGGFVIDTTGPRIENVTRSDQQFTSVFDPKPAGGPDPVIDSIVIHFSDGPERPVGRPYSAVLEELATEEGNYRLVGDANGNIPITSVEFIGGNAGPGIATTAVQLNFGIPLPDDRFTLSVSDRIADAAGNPLDGESGANAPFEGNHGVDETVPIFPTGDSNHGGDFHARFTIDSRPEIGVWAGGSVYVDTNGNFVFDQQNRDFVNRDIIYTVGFTSDDVFAGNFAGPNGEADGYDKLAAYGRYGGWVDGTFRWLIDLDNDGVADIDVEDPGDVNGLPVAGNFDGSDVNGDEVAIYTGNTWHFDTDRDYVVDFALRSQLKGYPIVGDFDRDGFDDLATWADDTFMVDLANGTSNGWDGVADTTFRFGFIGVRERPVAADMDQDGFDDLGLWVPDRGGPTPRESGEWYWLVSGGESVLSRIEPSKDPVRGQTHEIRFTPIPFGHDIFAQFGDEFAVPVVGNFDPPTRFASRPAPRLFTNPSTPEDVNGDGTVSSRDALLAVNYLNVHGATNVNELGEETAFLDTNGDGHVSAIDVLKIINYLNQESEEPVDAIAADVAAALSAADDVESAGG